MSLTEYALPGWMTRLQGRVEPDPYSTAWAALVPACGRPDVPAWPEALEALRRGQLDDGGWGAPGVFYAHDRTICTLAALHALDVWQAEAADYERIERGLAALRRYAPLLAGEAYQPVGFELLLPALSAELVERYAAGLPLTEWEPIEAMGLKKLALIRAVSPDPSRPRAWWFSLEMLPPAQLARLDDSILEDNGSIQTSTAATAAYLRARRLAGEDSPRAAAFIADVVASFGGGVPFCAPAEVFERVWALDNLRRAGLDPQTPAIAGVAQRIAESWHRNQPGLSSSDWFAVNDGDDTLVGYAVLSWAGLAPDEDAMLAFWNGDHFCSYPDERDPSVSANLHGLTALRAQPGFPRRDLAEKLMGWLLKRIAPGTVIQDKWHFSPFYSLAHAASAFAGWHDDAARPVVDLLAGRQRPDGGWGWFGRSTLEETGLVTLGLVEARREGVIAANGALAGAARFLQAHRDAEPLEQMYIGKTLFCPTNVSRSTVYAARIALAGLGYEAGLDGVEPRPPLLP